MRIWHFLWSKFCSFFRLWRDIPWFSISCSKLPLIIFPCPWSFGNIRVVTVYAFIKLVIFSISDYDLVRLWRGMFCLISLMVLFSGRRLWILLFSRKYLVLKRGLLLRNKFFATHRIRHWLIVPWLQDFGKVLIVLVYLQFEPLLCHVVTHHWVSFWLKRRRLYQTGNKWLSISRVLHNLIERYRFFTPNRLVKQRDLLSLLAFVSLSIQRLHFISILYN